MDSLRIIIVGIFSIISTWICAFIYNNCITKEYLVAYWISILLYYFTFCVAVASYFINKNK